MKYFSLIALVGLSTVNTIDFDGDGADDTKDDRKTMDDDMMMDGDEELWYEDMYEDMDDEEMAEAYYDALDVKEFVMLAAMNANQTADADGSDELGIFKVGLFYGNTWQGDIFYTDLNATDAADKGNYTKGWSKRFATDG